MADSKITGLTALTSVASTDLVEVVDVSDTSMAATGTNKQATVANLATAVSSALGLQPVATDTIWDAKGDLAVGTGVNTASKLTVGTNGYVLAADSAQSTGVKWQTALPFPRGSKAGSAYHAGVPGWFMSTTTASTALSQYDIYTFPIFLTHPITVSGVDVFVNGGNEAGKVLRVALYAANTDDAYDVGSLTTDWGTVDVTTSGAKAITGLSTSLAIGWHFIAVGTDASALTLYGARGGSFAQRVNNANGTGTLNGGCRWWYDYTSSPNYPSVGFPASLSGNSQNGSAFEASANATIVPFSLRYT